MVAKESEFKMVSKIRDKMYAGLFLRQFWRAF